MKIIFLILSISSFLFAQSESKESLIFYDSCPFECCQFGEWIIQDSIRVFSNEKDTSSISFMLSSNDTIVAETGNLHFLQLGIVVVQKEIYDFKPNDTLKIFNCIEGEFLVSHNGKKYYLDQFWPMAPIDTNDQLKNDQSNLNNNRYSGKIVQQPKSVWWVKISSKKGDGWIKLINQNPYCFSIAEKIEGMDGCG